MVRALTNNCNSDLVSVVVTTRNSAEFLKMCLESIRSQRYGLIELIVVDNNSTDATLDIAKKYADKVFSRGPERSAQRNYGLNQAAGKYVLFIDSDMVLTKDVVAECVIKMQDSPRLKGIKIPEKSIGTGFWSACKALERSYYTGVDWIEAARFFIKEAVEKIDGYNENMISGEDWDLSQRMEKLGELGSIQSLILHNEGKLTLMETLKKKYYYAQHFIEYMDENKGENSIKKQTGILKRYKLFFSHPIKLLRQPLYGFGMLFMKTCEFGFGGFGYIIGKAKNKSEK